MENWVPLLDWIMTVKPDLVIHTGDITADGSSDAAAFCYGVASMCKLQVPVRAVPGNHDIGDPELWGMEATARSLARWRGHLGVDRWVEDVEGYRLVGLNAMVIGSGDREEADQVAWWESLVSRRKGRRIILFLHKPFFLEDPGEGKAADLSISPKARGAWMDRMYEADVMLVASGHLHKARDTTVNSIRYIWSPSAAFCFGPTEPETPGEKRLGAVIYEIERGDIRARIAKVPGLVPHLV